jgi:hypothetical protein
VVTQDLTTYDETDPNAVWSQTATRNTCASLRRDDISFLSDDMGAGFFGANFEHKIDYKMTANQGRCVMCIWSVNDGPDSHAGIANGFTTWFHVPSDVAGTNPRTYMTKIVAGALTHDSYLMVSWDDDLYLTHNRTSTTLTCKIYSDSARTSLLDTLSLAVVTTTWQYIQAGFSWETETANGHGAKTCSGYVENLEFRAQPPVFHHHYQHVIGGKIRG